MDILYFLISCSNESGFGILSVKVTNSAARSYYCIRASASESSSCSGSSPFSRMYTSPQSEASPVLYALWTAAFRGMFVMLARSWHSSVDTLAQSYLDSYTIAVSRAYINSSYIRNGLRYVSGSSPSTYGLSES